jgi:hypothetical protein
MTIRIVINGNEVTNPFAKAFLVFGAVIVAAITTALVIFVLFPIIGIVVTLSAGFIAICIVATIVGITTLAFGTVMLGLLFGVMEFRLEHSRKKK